MKAPLFIICPTEILHDGTHTKFPRVATAIAPKMFTACVPILLICLASEAAGDRMSSIASVCLILAVSSRISQFKQDKEQLKKEICVKRDIEKTLFNLMEYPPNFPWKDMKCRLPIVHCFSKNGCKILCVTALRICFTMLPSGSKPLKERIIWFCMNLEKN